TFFGLTPEEAIAGMTINAARALGLAHSIGSVAAGKQADLCVWPIESLAELGYWVGLPRPERRIYAGNDAYACGRDHRHRLLGGSRDPVLGELRQSCRPDLHLVVVGPLLHHPHQPARRRDDDLGGDRWETVRELSRRSDAGDHPRRRGLHYPAPGSARADGIT